MGPEHHHKPESVLEYNAKKAGVDIINWLIIVFNTDTTAVRLPDNTTTIKLTLIS